MKTSKHYLVPLVLALGTWFVATFLDVIPAEVAPTCRPELKQFHRTLTSMQSLYGFGIAFSGCEYRPLKTTRWACLGVSLGSLATGAIPWSLACGAILAEISEKGTGTFIAETWTDWARVTPDTVGGADHALL